jgi:hypothetical protein
VLGRLVVGTKGTGSSPDLTVAREPERRSTPLPFSSRSAGAASHADVAGNSPCLRISTRRRRVASDQYFCCLRTYLIIRIGTSGREVGGGDHPTPVLLETCVTALRARAVSSLSGVPEYPDGTGLSGELDSGKSAEIESGARPMTPVLLLQQSQGERSRAWKGKVWRSEGRKRSGRATSCHASVRGGAKARTPFLRARTQDHYAGWLALGKTHPGTDTDSVGLVREED